MRFLLFSLIFIFNININSQINSIISSNERGRINDNNFSLGKFSGFGAAYSSSTNINSLNPASYTNANITLIELGLKSELVNSLYNDTTLLTSQVIPNHIAMLFPIIPNKCGLSIGLFNKNEVNYNISKNGEDSTFGKFNSSNSGSGKLYRLYIGSAYKVNNLSLGGNINFDFGSIKTISKMNFFDYDSLKLNSYRYINNNTNFNISYTLGAIYNIKLNRKNLNLGINYSQEFSSNSKLFVTKQSINQINSIYDQYIDVEDTSYKISSGKISELGIGINFNPIPSTKMGINFNATIPSNIKSKLYDENLYNGWLSNIGVEFSPFLNTDKDNRKYFRKVTYRAGFGIGKSIYNDQEFVDLFKFSTALTFPLSNRNFSSFTLGLDAKQTGLGSSKYQESNISLFVQFIIGDKWFVRPKFD